MDVYYDFFSYRSGIYSYATGTYQGGHAILLIGYDDVNQCFICKNSWGAGWGEGGYFRIAYSELTSATQFGDYTIAYVAGSTPPPPPPGDTCTYSLSPTSTTYTATGGTGSVSVTTGSNCGWTASDSASWMTITSGSSGTGSGKVTYSVDSYTGRNPRSASITVGGQTHSVKQNGTKRK
jgi:hypothetical protein